MKTLRLALATILLFSALLVSATSSVSIAVVHDYDARVVASSALITSNEALGSPPDLIVNGTSTTLSGNHYYNKVNVTNGGAIYVQAYDGSLSSGWLNITADGVFVDATSVIDADGSGNIGGVGGDPIGSVDGGNGAGLGGGIGGTANPPTGQGSGGGGGISYTDLVGSGGGGGGAYLPHGGAGEPWPGASGGAGGGAIILRAHQIEVYGTLSANGLKGGNAGVNGAGGGGSGGSIVAICSGVLTINGTIRARGGGGGNGPMGGGTHNAAGGGGGGGFGGNGGHGGAGVVGSTGGGGGGGGGVIKLYFGTFYNYSNGMDVSGGAGGAVSQGAHPGENGERGFVEARDYRNIRVTRVTTSKTGCLPKETVGQGFNLSVYVVVENQGEIAEAFNLTFFANSTIAGTLPVMLNPLGNQTLTFTWNTTAVPYGNYTISVKADLVAGELDQNDNTMADGTSLVTIAGDVDGDRDVDIFDIVRMASVYGVKAPDPGYDPNCDLDDDRDVDIFDIVAAVGNYGDSW